MNGLSNDVFEMHDECMLASISMTVKCGKNARKIHPAR